MKNFLDASVLVEACLLKSASYEAAARLVDCRDACTSAHAVAEAYATLSGDKRLGINSHDASRMVRDVAANLKVDTLDATGLLELIPQAPGRGVYGGIFFDAIHAQTARQLKCERIHTLNAGHFRHVAPDLEIHAL